MCFTTLPPELQEDIIIDLEKPDLYSLCLVSKSLLHLALPLLYRSIELHLDSWQRAQEDVARDMRLYLGREKDPVAVMNKAKAGFEGRERRQNKLIETLEAHQDRKKLIHEVNLDFDVSVEGNTGAGQLGHLLSSCPNLQVVSIDSAYDKATGSFLIRHIPTSVRSLHLGSSKLPATFVLPLLNKLSLLETLSLANSTDGLSPLDHDQPLPHLDHLRSLSLSHPFRGRSFFSAITSSSNSLSSLVIDFIGVQALVRERLSNLTRLSIRGGTRTSHGRSTGYSENLAFDLVEIFKNCQSLQYLEIRATDFYVQREPMKHSEAFKMLHHLPTTLRALALEAVNFSGDYLSDYFQSPQNRLLRLDCSRLLREEDRSDASGTTSYDEGSEDRMEEICEAVNIHLKWIGGRVKGQRSGEISAWMEEAMVDALCKLGQS